MYVDACGKIQIRFQFRHRRELYYVYLFAFVILFHIPIRFRRITCITRLTTTDWNFSFFDASDQKYKISSSKTPSPEKTIYSIRLPIYPRERKSVLHYIPRYPPCLSIQQISDGIKGNPTDRVAKTKTITAEPKTLTRGKNAAAEGKPAFFSDKRRIRRLFRAG